MIVNKKYKLNKEWLDLMLENKNNTNLTFNLSDNDTRILLTYIEVLQQENSRLKENNMSMQEEMTRTWEKADLYKEVIEEIREYIEDWLFDAGGNGASMTYKDINELLQILDKVRGDYK